MREKESEGTGQDWGEKERRRAGEKERRREGEKATMLLCCYHAAIMRLLGCYCAALKRMQGGGGAN